MAGYRCSPKPVPVAAGVVVGAIGIGKLVLDRILFCAAVPGKAEVLNQQRSRTRFAVAPVCIPTGSGIADHVNPLHHNSIARGAKHARGGHAVDPYVCHGVMGGGVAPLDAIAREIGERKRGVATVLLRSPPAGGKVRNVQASHIHVGAAA